MNNLKTQTLLLRWTATLTVLLTGFAGFATQAAQADETSCDVNTSTVLIGCDFQNSDLSGKSLNGYVISNSNFSGTNLQNTDLQNVNLVSNTFSSGTQLNGANLSNSNLSGVNLSGIYFGGAHLNSANLSSSNLTGANFSNADLTNANLNSADLTSAVLNGANVTNTDFSSATLDDLSGRSLQGEPLLLPNQWVYKSGYLFGPKANLSNISLPNWNLSNLDLSGANLTNAYLYTVNLSGAKLVGANLTNTNLFYSDLTNTDFSNANLTSTNLIGAYIRGTNFSYSTMNGIQRNCDFDEQRCWQWFDGYWDWYNHRYVQYRVGFSDAVLTGVKSSAFPKTVSYHNYYWYYYGWWYCGGYGGCLNTRSISLPSGWANRNGTLIGPGVDLTGLNIRGWDLSNFDLSNVKLGQTDLVGANFSNSTLTNIDLSGRDLTNINFSGANLTGVNFAGSILSGANFYNSTLTGANFEGVDLSSTTLDYSRSGSIVGEPAALPYGWKQIKGWFVGRTARLSNADLSNSDLSGMDLSYASFSYANLGNSKLDNANFFATDLNNANFQDVSLSGVSSGSISGGPNYLPQPWLIIRGYLVGPKAKLRGADLSNVTLTNADFSQTDLTNTNFYQANLRSSNFTGAKLQYTNFNYSDLTNANFNGASLDSSYFEQAKINNVDFTNARLTYLTFNCTDWWRCYYYNGNNYYTYQSAILNHTYGYQVNFNGYFSLPSGWSVRNGLLLGTNANLSGLNLNQMDLSGLNLSDADFTSTNLSSVNLSSANLTNANFSGATLTSVNLTDTSAANSIFRSATLRSVNLSNADISNAIFSEIDSRGLTINTALPAGWVSVNGTLIGAGAHAVNSNLLGANLEGVDLTGIDLTNSNLTGVNFRGANLTDAVLVNSNLTNADITGANLTLADVSGAVLDGIRAVDLIGAPNNMPSGWVLQDGRFVGTISISKVVISGTLEIGQTLSAAVAASPSQVDYSYTWFRNGVAIEGATSSSYQIKLEDLAANISVRVIASKAGYVPAASNSSEVYISNIFDSLTNMNLEGQAAKDGSITMNFTGNRSFSSLIYQVSRDGGSSWSTIAGPNYNIQFSDLGGTLKFRVIESAYGYVSKTNEFDEISVDGTFSLPGYSVGSIDGANSGGSIQGAAKVGSMLKTTKGTWPSSSRVTGFWWSSNGAAVSNKLMYRSGPQDIGATLMYIEVGVSPNGVTRYRLSEPIVITPNTFDSSSKPLISGSTVIGSKLRASFTGWERGAKYSLQWLSDGEEIYGATSSSYTITADDVGSSLSVRLCATKLAFTSKCEESLATGVINKSEIKVSAKPLLRQTSTKLGRQLSALLGKWQQGVIYSYQWFRDGIALNGETREIYVMTPNDSGHSFALQVTGSKVGYLDLTRASDAKVFN